MEDIGRRKALWIEVLVVVAWLIVPVVVSQFVGTYSPDPKSMDLHRAWEALSYLGRIGALAFIIWQSGDAFRSFGIVKEEIVPAIVITALLLGLNVAIYVVMSPAHALPHVSSNGFANTSIVGWIAGLSMTILLATYQEILYRCYLITRLRELLGGAEWAILISFLLFGATHIANKPEGFVGYSLFGLIQAIAFVRTKSVVPVAAAHMLRNVWFEMARLSVGA